jgi:hypothetical protein
MATTVANVPVGGRPYQIGAGSLKETITDVTIADNSEAVTAAQLGLSAVFSARAEIQDGQTSDTAVYATATIATGSVSVTVALFTADGTAATTSATTVVRVYAAGY